VISDCINSVTDLAHRLDLALGHHHQLHHASSSGSISGEYGVSSYVDAYMAEDSVFDMEEIDVQVGYETAAYDSDGQDVEVDPVNPLATNPPSRIAVLLIRGTITLFSVRSSLLKLRFTDHQASIK